MPKKKKEETLEDIIDRMEEDLQKIRDKALESEDEEFEEDEDFDDDNEEEDED
jgi:ribosome recycling factor